MSDDKKKFTSFWGYDVKDLGNDRVSVSMIGTSGYAGVTPETAQRTLLTTMSKQEATNISNNAEENLIRSKLNYLNGYYQRATIDNDFSTYGKNEYVHPTMENDRPAIEQKYVDLYNKKFGTSFVHPSIIQKTGIIHKQEAAFVPNNEGYSRNYGDGHYCDGGRGNACGTCGDRG